jgi:pimeloyl-ACP methyl ester carboxylesterase
MSNSPAPGTCTRHSVESTLPLDYFVYVPREGVRDDRVLVSVHGISRNAEEHVVGFSGLAERYGAAIVAPLLPAGDFSRYQRLGVSAREARADLAFDRILEDAAGLIGIDPLPLRIFGFSGGGQFAHRYALFYPKRVARQVLGAPGWYTFPDPENRYPLGLRSAPEWPKLRFNPTRFLKIPTLVMVGERDDVRDKDLNKTRQIDTHQGLDRMERGRRWVGAMRGLARAYALPGDFEFRTVPGADHAYANYLAQPEFAEGIFTFLFGPENAPSD